MIRARAFRRHVSSAGYDSGFVSNRHTSSYSTSALAFRNAARASRKRRMYRVRKSTSARRPSGPKGASKSSSSVIRVPSGVASKRCTCRIRLNAPRTISSVNSQGRSNSVTTTVSSCQTPRCRARHVTDSPMPISPDVTPATARSPVAEELSWCTSTSRIRSNTRSGAARMIVASRMRATS